MKEKITVRPVVDQDRDWVLQFLERRWGSDRMVRHGDIVFPADQRGLLAIYRGESTGLLTYDIVGDACEITLIDTEVQHAGIGTALLNAVQKVARESGCVRQWLVTTNDNLDALRFYQRRGFSLFALHAGSIEAARRLKPEIPLLGDHNIPLRDELDLEMQLLT